MTDSQCWSFGNMFKSEFYSAEARHKYMLSDTCVTMLYSAIKVHMIKYQGASEYAND